MAEGSSTKWISIIVGIIIAALGAFGVAQFIRGNQEEERRIEAQNEIARMSEIMKEQEGVWSRLAVQSKDVIEHLRSQNSGLADTIESRDEQVQNLVKIVGNLRNIRVVVREENISQTQEPDNIERARVTFDQEWENFIRIYGFTLTNPPEADINLEWTRPVNFTIVTTQLDDLSWRNYLTSDMPNLEIGSIEGIVNPRPLRSRTFVENIIIGGGLLINPTQFDAGFGEVFLLYSFESAFAIGPVIGIGIAENSDFMVGLHFQWKPWRQ